ncbi:MAG: molybdopterin molybdotransferase MoeA [Saprospiraceae bacterium]|nr:molybdopterin molybdotransferase MoeA [Saprospiraceae bacterium]
MISYKEALSLIEQQTAAIPRKTEERLIDSALGFILAADVFAPIDSPPFDQSAMDGFAISALCSQSSCIIQGSIQAGDTTEYSLKGVDHAFKIFTGAPIPKDANAVIIQENTTQDATTVYFDTKDVIAGSNVRLRGSQIKKGALVAPMGTLLTPAVLSYLTSLGISNVKVVSKPRVSMLVTGKELMPIGHDLEFGQIYESNSLLLKLALSEGSLKASEIKFVGDDLAATTEAIKDMLIDCDVLLITGGISVGEYDLVRPALEANDVSTIFYKIKQKPGKPLYFGRKDEKSVFALPGNPASVFVCFYEYVVPCLRMLAGLPFSPNHQMYLPLAHDYFKKGTFTNFLKAKIINNEVNILEGQESYKLHPFIETNALAILPEETNYLKSGELVCVHKISEYWT